MFTLPSSETGGMGDDFLKTINRDPSIKASRKVIFKING